MEALREATVVCRHELRHALRSGRAAALAVLAALGALVAAALFVLANRRLFEGALATEPTARAVASEALAQALAWLVGGDEPAARALVERRIPPLVLFASWLVRAALPLLAVVLCHDAIAREMGTRSVRFVLLRARRGAFLAGKAAGQLVLLLGLVALAWAVVLGYGALRQPGFALGPALAFSARVLMGMALQGAAYVALVMIASSLASRGAQALGFALILVFGLWLAGLLGRSDALAFLSWLVPASYEKWLAASDLAGRAKALGAYAAFAAAYLGVAWAILRWRDA